MPIDPSRQAWVTSGRWRSVRPRRTRRLAAARETRQRAESHDAAVLAPSAAHSSPPPPRLEGRRRLGPESLKARRQALELFHRLAVPVVLRTRFDERLECFGEVGQLHVFDGSTELSQPDDVESLQNLRYFPRNPRHLARSEARSAAKT